MKTAIAAALSILLAIPALALAAGTAGTVTAVKGKVTAVAPGQTAEAAVALKQELAPGTRVKTGDDGQVTITLTDGAVLELRPGSSLALSANERKRSQKSSVMLVFGRLWSKISTSTSGKESYEIATANAVAGVRGTEFETTVGVDGSVRVKVTQGKVAVGEDDEGDEEVAEGQVIEGDEGGVAKPGPAAGAADDAAWQRSKEERLRGQGGDLGKKLKDKIMARKAELEKLRAEQQRLLKEREGLEQRLKGGDRGVVERIKEINLRLADLADEIAGIGDQATSQFGLYDKYEELANTPGFRMIGAKYIKAEYESLMRVKKGFDAMVAEGTDISMKAMDDMLKDMGSGKPSTIKDKGGSSAKDLFGDDPMGGF